MRSHVDPDATESGSPQVASNSVYGIISGASYEYQRLKLQIACELHDSGQQHSALVSIKVLVVMSHPPTLTRSIGNSMIVMYASADCS